MLVLLMRASANIAVIFRVRLPRGASMKVPEEGLRLLLEVSKHSIRKYLKYDDMFSYAAALAYRVLFAIVPFLALLIALPWFFGIGGFFVEWLSDQTSAASQGPIAGVVGEWIK